MRGFVSYRDFAPQGFGSNARRDTEHRHEALSGVSVNESAGDVAHGMAL